MLGSAYFAVLLLQLFFAALGGFGTVVIILFLSWLLAFVVSPLIAWIEDRSRFPRSAIVVGTYLMALVALGFVLFYTGTAVTQQVTDLAQNYPDHPRPASSRRWRTGSATSSSAAVEST